MAKRKYEEEKNAAMNSCNAAVPRFSRGEDDWQKRERRDRALTVAQALSEPGCNADDVIEDAKKYYHYLGGE